MRKYVKRVRRPRRRINRRRGRSGVPRGPGGKRLGGFTILRHTTTPFYLTNSSTQGVPIISDPPAGTPMFNLGAPTVHPVFTNLYSVPFATSFSLDQIDGYNELTALGDLYRINKVWIRAKWNTSAIGGADSGSGYATAMPTLYWIEDYDDANVQSVPSIRQKMGLHNKALSSTRYVQLAVRPKPAVSAFNTSTSTTSAYVVPKGSSWVNSTYPSVAHYGLKGYIDNMDLLTVNSVTSCLTLEVLFSVSLKNLQ